MAALTVTTGFFTENLLKYKEFPELSLCFEQVDFNFYAISHEFFKPFTRCLRVGVHAGATTRVIPDLIIISTQGGVLPQCVQGSDLTYNVAPLALRPACLIAYISACGGPELFMVAFPDNFTILDDDSAYHRVRKNPILASRGKFKRLGHE